MYAGRNRVVLGYNQGVVHARGLLRLRLHAPEFRTGDMLLGRHMDTDGTTLADE